MTSLCVVLLLANLGGSPKASETAVDSELELLRKAQTRFPMAGIEGPHAPRVREIVEKPILYRRGPLEVIPCPPGLLEWLVKNPDLVAEYWKELGAQVSEIETTEDGYIARDSDRLLITFHVLVEQPDLRVVYCLGEARRPPLPGSMKAELVIVQRYKYMTRPDGRHFVVQQLEGFAGARGPALKAIMKLAKPTSERLVDGCLQEMSVYFSVVSRLMEVRPKWAIATADRLAAARPSALGEYRALQEILRTVPDHPARERLTPAGLADFSVPLETSPTSK